MAITKKYLVINADDFGMCNSVNEASIDAFLKGCVTSLSIMPCGPYFDSAVLLAKKAKVRHLGVHLTLTSEFRNLRWKPVAQGKKSSLVDKDGFFHRTINKFTRYAKRTEIVNELESQIQKAIRYGIIPTHLDCHMFLLHTEVCLRKDLMPVILYLCKKYSLPFRSPFVDECRYLQKNKIAVLSESFKESYDIPARLKVKRYRGFIQNIKPGISEMILHCGYDNEELRKITKHSLRRKKDYDFALARSTREFIHECGAVPASWRDAARYLLK